MSIILLKKLSIKEQQEVLSTLFGFSLEQDSSGEYILYDENGMEFYKSAVNAQFDFSTLAGIFSYAAYRFKMQGFADCQLKIKKSLGL